MPYSEISNSDHQFFWGALSQKQKKREDDFSGNNKSRFENIFQALREIWFWKQREFLNKLCLRQNIRVMAYPQGGICIMAYLQGDIGIMV